MLFIEDFYEGDAPATRSLTLSYDYRTKSRLRTTLDSGETLGLFLPRGTILRGGHRLLASDGSIVEVFAADESLLEARCENLLDLTCAAYHLGNRHVAVQVGGDMRGAWLRLAADHVLEMMLSTIGCDVHALVAPFEPESGAYAPGHTHNHGDSVDRRSPRIHEYTARTASA